MQPGLTPRAATSASEEKLSRANKYLAEDIRTAILAMAEEMLTKQKVAITPGKLAKAICELESGGTALFWIAVRDGEIDGATVGDRLRASENLANRGALPTITKAEIQVDEIPAKLVTLQRPTVVGIVPRTPVTVEEPHAEDGGTQDSTKVPLQVPETVQ
jgi:hypothetical protein